MIDSVVWRLHDLEAHIEITNALNLVSTGAKFREDITLEWETYQCELLYGDFNFTPYDQIINGIHYLDSGEKRQLIKGYYPPPSSHYDIGYRINTHRDYIEFSFSIPKYLFGHNIAQFIKHSNSGFNYHFIGMQGNFEQLIKADGYRMFMDFMKMFIKETFRGMAKTIKRENVEIVRIDFCYNQFFKSKEEAFEYSSYMYKQMYNVMKRNRTSSTKSSIEDYHNGGFLVKSGVGYHTVYHKGSEFTYSDKRTLTKFIDSYYKEQKKYGNIKAMNAKRYHDLDVLQKTADKILRHESKMQRSYMSYYFKKYVYRSKDPYYKEQMKRYKKIKAHVERIRRAHIKGITIDPINKTDYKFYKAFKESVIEKRHSFWLWPSDQIKNDQKHGQMANFREQHFSKELFEYLALEVFWKKVKQAQVKAQQDYDTVEIKLTQHNDEVKTRIRKLENMPMLKQAKDYEINKLKKKIISDRVYKTIRLLQNQYGDLQEAFRHGAISKATKNRYIKVLEKLDETSVVLTKSHIKNDISYREYLHQVRLNPRTGSELFFTTTNAHKNLYL